MHVDGFEIEMLYFNFLIIGTVCSQNLILIFNISIYVTGMQQRDNWLRQGMILIISLFKDYLYIILWLYVVIVSLNN